MSDVTHPLEVLLDLDVLRVADDADFDELNLVVVVVPVVCDVDSRVVGRLTVEEGRVIDAHDSVDRPVCDLCLSCKQTPARLCYVYCTYGSTETQ